MASGAAIGAMLLLPHLEPSNLGPVARVAERFGVVASSYTAFLLVVERKNLLAEATNLRRYLSGQ